MGFFVQALLNTLILTPYPLIVDRKIGCRYNKIYNIAP